jgi:hypothetical protein
MTKYEKQLWAVRMIPRKALKRVRGAAANQRARATFIYFAGFKIARRRIMGYYGIR